MLRRDSNGFVDDHLEGGADKLGHDRGSVPGQTDVNSRDVLGVNDDVVVGTPSNKIILGAFALHSQDDFSVRVDQPSSRRRRCRPSRRAFIVVSPALALDLADQRSHDVVFTATPRHFLVLMCSRRISLVSRTTFQFLDGLTTRRAGQRICTVFTIATKYRRSSVDDRTFSSLQMF